MVSWFQAGTLWWGKATHPTVAGGTESRKSQQERCPLHRLPSAQSLSPAQWLQLLMKLVLSCLGLCGTLPVETIHVENAEHGTPSPSGTNGFPSALLVKPPSNDGSSRPNLADFMTQLLLLVPKDDVRETSLSEPLELHFVFCFKHKQ